MGINIRCIPLKSVIIVHFHFNNIVTEMYNTYTGTENVLIS